MSVNSLSRNSFNDFFVWQYKPWLDKGWLHGFTDSSLDFKMAPEDAIQKLKSSFAVKSVSYLRQVHGDSLIAATGSDLEAGGELGEADALAVKVNNYSSLGLCFGVFTADCVPVLIRNDNALIAIHAGWRGLSSNIIAKSILAVFDDFTGTEAIIGPCAGINEYIVGRDVLESIPESSFIKRGANLHLNLEQTALNQINKISTEIKVITSGISTISDSRFHSFRRDSKKAGRNYAFHLI